MHFIAEKFGEQSTKNSIEGEQGIDDLLKKYMETCACECPAHTNEELFPIMSELFEIKLDPTLWQLSYCHLF